MPVAWRIGVLAAGAGMYFLVRTSSAVLLVSSISQLICSVIYQSLLTFHCLCIASLLIDLEKIFYKLKKFDKDSLTY